MVDSSEFAHYYLTKWKLEDDSLSCVDHDYWEGLINQIVESRRFRNFSDLGRDRIFQKAFDRLNKPPHDGSSKSKRYNSLSEARKFKLIIESIWNVSAAKDRGYKLNRGGRGRIAHDPADDRPRRKNFSNTVCSMPSHTKGFFSFVVETLHAAREYASSRNRILALRQSFKTDSEGRQSKETASFTPKESPRNRKELRPDQAVSVASNRAGQSRNKSSFKANNSPSRQEELYIGDATSFSSNIAGHSFQAEADRDRLMPNSSNKLEHSIAPNSSEQSDPLRHSIRSEEVTVPIAPVPNILGHSIDSYHPPLVGIDITGHGSLIIKKVFLHKRKESMSALGVPLDVLCTQSKDYIVCGLKSWSKGGHVQGQLALDIVGVWFEKAMRQYFCQRLTCFISELDAGQQLDFRQLYNAAGGFSLVASRSKFDLVPGDAVVASRSQNVSQNSSSHRHLLQITNQNVAGKFIGRGGASAREAEKILGLLVSIKRFGEKEYFACKPCTHQNLDRQEEVNRERCRIGLEIISIWIWEHWNAQNEYIDLPEFLSGLKASNDKTTLEEIYEAAVHSMRRKRLPYSHKAFFESNYTMEAESQD